MIDRTGLAGFLRNRREALQPEDVGMPRGQRRRTSGLRREEVATLCNMSADYYSRLERERGPQPSQQMLASIAQGLHLSIDERDHLFRLAGHNPPPRGSSSEHISPGLLRILDRLEDLYAPEEHAFLTRMYAAGLRGLVTLRGPESRAAYLAGLLLDCQRLVDPGQAHSLMVYTAVPGTESYEKLQVLSVIGAQALRPSRW